MPVHARDLEQDGQSRKELRLALADESSVKRRRIANAIGHGSAPTFDGAPHSISNLCESDESHTTREEVSQTVCQARIQAGPNACGAHGEMIIGVDWMDRKKASGSVGPSGGTRRHCCAPNRRFNCPLITEAGKVGSTPAIVALRRRIKPWKRQKRA